MDALQDAHVGTDDDGVFESLDAVLRHWAFEFDKEDAWTEGDCSARTMERRIMALAAEDSDCRLLPEGVEFLYRGHGIPDEAAKILAAGGTVSIEPSFRLLTSWTLDQDVARRFAVDAAEGCLSSAVVLAVRVDRLDVVARIPKDVGMEDEVLVRSSETLIVQPSDILALWVYDEDLGEAFKIEPDATSAPAI